MPPRVALQGCFLSCCLALETPISELLLVYISFILSLPLGAWGTHMHRRAHARTNRQFLSILRIFHPLASLTT